MASATAMLVVQQDQLLLYCPLSGGNGVSASLQVWGCFCNHHGFRDQHCFPESHCLVAGEKDRYPTGSVSISADTSCEHMLL